MTKNKSLYSRAVAISTEFLGPAGERFLQRQISTHLHIKPDELQQKDLLELVDWVRLAVSLLTDDEELVDDFTSKLLQLTNGAPNGMGGVVRNGHSR